MTKVKKIVLVVSVLLVLCFTFCVTSFADMPTPSVLSNPYCPSLYGSYSTTSGMSTRSCGGYVQDWRFLQNSRSTMYMTTQYLTYCDGARSIFNDGYTIRSMGAHDSWSPWYLTDSIIYGCSTLRGNSNYSSDNYIYFPTYYARDVGISFYFSEGPSSNVSTIDTIYTGNMVDFGVTYSLAITWIDENYSFHSKQIDYIDSQLTESSIYAPNVTDNSFTSVSHILDLNGVSWNDNCHIYSVGIVVYYDYAYNSQRQIYSNHLFAIPDAEDYINNKEYVQGLRDWGYEQGFSDGSDIENFGVLGFIGSSIGGMLAIEIFDGFAIGHIVLVAIVVPLFIWILKIFGGG